MLFSYNLSLGAFDTAGLGDKHYPLAACLFLIASIFLIVIMLNFLVAVISDTFARVQEVSMNTMYQNMAELIVENEDIADQDELRKMDSQGDYLYMSFIEGLDADGEEIDIEIDDLRNMLEDKTENIDNQIAKLLEII